MRGRETFDSEGNTSETRVPEYCGGLLPLLKCSIRKEFLYYIWLKKTRVQVLMVSYSCNVFKSSTHTYFQVGKPRQTGVCYLCKREEEIWRASLWNRVATPRPTPITTLLSPQFGHQLVNKLSHKFLTLTSFLLPPSTRTRQNNVTLESRRSNGANDEPSLPFLIKFSC